MGAKVPDDHAITSIEALEALYGTPKATSLVKELDHVSDHYRAFIAAAPFVVLATRGPEGLDCSPRGDPPGFVQVLDDRTLAIPDRRGNNRLDSLRNIVRDPSVSLLFLIPGIGETIRVNGTARLTLDPALLETFAIKGKPPRSVILVTVGRIYFQCQKALARSGLWDPEARVARAALPSAGEILQALMTEPFDGTAYDDAYPARMKETIY